MAHSCDLSQVGSSGSFDANRRARRVLEGGIVTEERFLQLQCEVYRLRREATAKEAEHKLLIARLSRAEDAAKRNMRDCFQQSLEPCKMKANIIAAVNHTFRVDQKMQELDDKLREKERQVEKVTEYNRQYKADIHSLKTRLDILLRTTRRTSPFVTPRDIHSAGAAQHEKGVKECRKDMQRLQTENLNLQLQIRTLSQPPPSAEAATQSSQSMQDMASQLEEGELPVQSAQAASTKLLVQQIQETWQQLEGLQKLYENSMEELQSLKGNHEKIQGKLRDASRDLNKERDKSLRLEISEMRLQQELVAAHQTGVLLQQTRQHNLQLENENAELIAAALTTHIKPKPLKVEDMMVQTSPNTTTVEDMIVQSSPKVIEFEDMHVQTSPNPLKVEDTMVQTSPNNITVEDTMVQTSPNTITVEDMIVQISPKVIEFGDMLVQTSPNSLRVEDMIVQTSLELESLA